MTIVPTTATASRVASKWGRWLATLLLLFMANHSNAQLKPLTLEELVSGGKNFNAMLPKTLSTEWWGEQLVKRNGTEWQIYSKNKQWTPLFSLKDADWGADGMPENLSNGHWFFANDNKTQVTWQSQTGCFTYDWNTHQLTRRFTLPAHVTDARYSPDGSCVAFSKNHNLSIHQLDRQQTTPITTDGNAGLVYGESVHRNEFGIEKGIFWSPNSQYICFYRMDQSMVTNYPLVRIEDPIAQAVPETYPMAGQTSHRVSIGVYNVQTGQTIWLQTGDNLNQYYCCITWSPDSRSIFLYNLNRDQNHATLQQYDAQTGRLKDTLYEESHPKYVEPQHDLIFLPWDEQKFLYHSEKNGYNHLYLYDLKQHKTLRQVTPDTLGVVLDVVGFQPKQKSVLLTATSQQPLNHLVYSVSVDKAKAQLLSSNYGIHKPQPNATGTQIIDKWSAPELPRQIDLLDAHRAQATLLYQAPNPWEGYAMPQVKHGTLTAADGHTTLHYRMVLPPDFDPNKQYPTVVYVYGGPHTRLVEASWLWGYRGLEIYMAQKGYIFFILDGRGSSERGRAFEDVTFRHLGREEVKDQMQGIAYLRTLPYIDQQRIGVHGWSFGGFMTINLMLTHPEVFKCGVAGGPVTNWAYYEVMYGERYMDTPQTNPEGYKESNLCLRADRLNAPLQIIFGYNDATCVPQHTLQFIRACIDAGKQPDLFTYPGQEHNMRQRDRVHLCERITQYFEQHLK